MRALTAAILAAGALLPDGALAHAGRGLEPASYAASLSVALLLALYGVGYAKLARRSRGGADVKPLFIAMAGLATLALLSPAAQALAERSFAMHMLEHEIIVMAVAPLIAAGAPGAALAWSLPRPLRRALGRTRARDALHRLWRAATRPFAATLLHSAALWA